MISSPSCIQCTLSCEYCCMVHPVHQRGGHNNNNPNVVTVLLFSLLSHSFEGSKMGESATDSVALGALDLAGNKPHGSYTLR